MATQIKALPQQGPQVFISFRGQELRRGFVSHLYDTLKRAGINVFIDSDASAGQDLKSHFQRIEESDIALVILSSRYTESKWCMDELVKVMECSKKREGCKNLRVIPILYKIDTSIVKGLEGEFGVNLLKLWKKTGSGRGDRIVKWDEALQAALEKGALILAENGSESDFVTKIVASVKDVITIIDGGEGTNTLSRNISSLMSSRGNDSSRDIRESERSSSYANTNADFLDSKVKPPEIQVFINFSGELRNYFISDLRIALLKSGINVYIDTHANRGDNLNTLFKRIEDSGIAIVVFSSSYTKSNWCLEELVKIKERADLGLLKVLPIFYKVTPNNVRRLKGEFGDNFRDKESVYASDKPKLKRWKEAIAFVSKDSTLIFKEKSDESEIDFIITIAMHVKNVTTKISLEQIQKSHDRLSEQQEDTCMDSSRSEDLKGMECEIDGMLWGKKSDRNPKEAEIVQAEENSRSDVGLNPSKDENILDKRADPIIEETKQDNFNESSTMVTYDKPLPEHPEVFINFCGADLRHSFVDHLAKALKRDGVKVYIDVDGLLHEDTTKQFFKRIEESRIALVIFSRRYTESRGLLNKLVKIKELMDEGKLLVIPIFYKVEPFEVRQLKGDLGVNFWNLWRIDRDHHIIQWKEALESVASMVGICSKENSSESDFIAVTVEEIVKRISLQRAKSTEFPTRKGEKYETYLNKHHLFGMELRRERLEKKLEFDCNETRIVGVVGMPGIGKTTLAMMLYDKWNCKFLRCVPLLGIRKKAEDYGPMWLRTTLLEMLLEGKFPMISDKTTHESVQDKLLQTKAFVILDDVSNKKQLEFLLGDLDWIKKGSKIVITTCDKSLLEGFSHDTYEVPKLNDREAFQLFSYHAFGDQTFSPTDAFLTLARMLLAYAGGHPLALSLLGRELHGKDKGHWEYILEAVTENSNILFQDVWGFFTDKLNERQKDVFLDIVCFFKSEDEYFVRSLLDSQNPDSTNAVSEVKDLVKKFLITISDGRVEMNGLLYALSKDIGSRRWLRMWNYKDIISKLKKMKLSDAHNVRGIFLDMSKLTKNIYLDSSTFIDMRNLRYLKIYNSCCLRQCKVNGKLYFSDGVEFPLEEVRYLHWLKFPLKELPTDFIPRNLVDLRLPHSKIERIWEGVKDTPQLKWVDLSHSSNLLDLSALSRAENLQRLNLEGCKILDKLPVEIQNMKSLVFMNMRGCTRLSYLPEMNLISLKTLILSDCLNLEKFQLISENIEVLHLDGTAIKGLPPAIKKLQRLVVLNLKNCNMLECLPNCLRELKALEQLILSGCSRLKNLSIVRENMKHLQSLLIDRIGAKMMPNISCATISEGQASADTVFLQPFGPREWPRGVNEVSSLRRLCLSGNDFVSLQTDIGKLYNLNWLDVKECKMLTSIPMLPPRLKYFDAHGCDSLERVANPLALPVLSDQIHATFNFSNCNNLNQDATDSITSYIRWKSELVLDALSRHKGGYDLEDFTGTCFPGWEIPAWFSHQVSGSVLEPKLPPHWCDNRFTGIALCALILFPSYHKQRNHLLLKCNCVFNYEDGSHIGFNCTFGRWRKPSNTPVKTESSHVFIGYTSMLDIKKQSEDGDSCRALNRSSFEFQLTDGTEGLENCEVLKCGFRLVYATNERESISWDAKTVNIPGGAHSYGNSGRDDGIQYESYSGLTMGRAKSFSTRANFDATPSLQKSFENKKADLLNEESEPLRDTIISSYRDNTSSGNLTELNMHPLVGFEKRLKKMEKVLYSTPGKTRILGVVGMPGIGKTTLATILFERRGCKFPNHLFLAMSKKYSLEQLRSALLKELLKHVNQDIDDETTRDSVKDKLLKTKIFVVLDDVSDKKQLEFMLGNLNWIKKGSKIVITTRYKSLLEGFADDTYVVQQLNNREASQLFTYHAFYNQISVSEKSLSLSRMFVDNVPGNPLDLKLLGSDLCGKGEVYWQHELQRVRQSFNMKMRDVWRFSINQLNERQRDVFLDIVYFFKSEEAYFVKGILDSGNPEEVSEVRDLADKFLITISGGRVEMHDQLYTFGKDLGSPRQLRLCNYKDIINKVSKLRQQEVNNVRGISLDMSEVKEPIALECMLFAGMRNLLYLKIYDSYCPRECKADCNLIFPDGLKFPLEEVRYLHWVKFPLEELPPDFRPNNLVDLRLPYSKIERIWEGVKDTPRLKWVDLSHSSKLVDLSALSKAENLQRLNLEGCTSLDELPVEIQNMKSLVYLNLRGCTRLCYLPKMNLISLKTLILSDCSNLMEFQLISESVEFLRLDGTAIERLPPAIKNLQRLVMLNLKNCKMLECLPNCLGELKFLDELILSGCSRLKSLPDVRHSLKHLQILLLDGTGANEMPSISCFTKSEDSASTDISLQPFGFYATVREFECGINGVSSLRRLILSGNDFTTLQPDIGKLYNLNWLDVKQCTKLICVPTLPPRLQYFDAHGCDSLERVANPLALPLLSEQNHVTFIFSNCNKLDQDSKDNIISYTRWRSQLMLDELTRYDGGSILEAITRTCFPGWEVPEWFSHRAFGPVLKPKLPLHWSDSKIIGIGLCAVISFHGYHEQRNRLLVKCDYVFHNEDRFRIGFSCTIGRVSESSDTSGKVEPCVFIGYTSLLDIKKLVEEDEEGCSRTKASLEFKVTDGTELLKGCEVLKCGFSLIYATDELRVKSGVRRELFEENDCRAYSKNMDISDVRRETEAAERSPDGGDKLLQATSPQPSIAKSPVSLAEYGTGSNSSGRERHIRALHVDARLSGEPQHHSDDLIPTVASSSQAGIRQSHSQVFISYYGAELHKTFVKHLVSTLTDAGVNVFTDKDKGNEIKQLMHLYQRIEESKIALVIFSKRYVESKFCLNELVMMDELAKEGKILVIPVFYNVRSSHVRNLNGEFGQRFKEMKERYKDELVKVMKWETSVKSIAKTLGIDSGVYSEDGRLVEATTEAVQRALTTISEGNPKYLGSANAVIDHVFAIFVCCLFILFSSFLLYFYPFYFPSGLWLEYIMIVVVVVFAWALTKMFAAGKTRRNNSLRLHHHHL